MRFEQSMPIPEHPDGVVVPMNTDQIKRERDDAAELQYAVGDVNSIDGLDSSGTEISYLSDPQMIQERLDAIEMELADQSIDPVKQNQLMAEMEHLTIKLADLKAQNN